MFIERMKGQDYIDQTRAYLDYLEEHLSNVAKAFQEVAEACKGMELMDNTFSMKALKREVEEHDLSKFSEKEFVQYRDKFFPVIELPDNTAFDYAWEHHKANNSHHWESIRYDSSLSWVIKRDIMHMVIDWTAMGYKFGDTAEDYYLANAHKIRIHPAWLPLLESIFVALRKHNELSN